MISSICRRSTSRETVAAADGSICSITRSRSEAHITGWWIKGSPRFGGDAGEAGVGTALDAGKLGGDADELGADAGESGIKGALVANVG
jgi:hypothetical protein